MILRMYRIDFKYLCVTIQKIHEGKLIEEFGKMPIFESRDNYDIKRDFH